MAGNTRQVSDLQKDYCDVLKGVSKDHPVYLEEDGEIGYVLMTVEDYLEYEQAKAMYQLMQGLKEQED